MNKKMILILLIMLLVVVITVIGKDMCINKNNAEVIYTKEVVIDEIKNKIQSIKLQYTNREDYSFTLENNVIPILEQYGTYDNDSLTLITNKHNYKIMLYEVYNVQASELIQVKYNNEMLEIKEKMNLMSNGYQYEYSFDGGVTWIVYDEPVEFKFDLQINVAIKTQQHEVVSQMVLSLDKEGIIKEIVSMNVKQETVTKNIYKHNEPFNTAGMKIVLTYNDGSIKEIGDSEFQVSTPTYAQSFVIISYGQYKTYQEVTVERVLESIEVKTNPFKMVYNVGEYFSDEGMILMLKYTDGSIQEVSSGYTYDLKGPLNHSDKIVKIMYKDKETSLNISVEYIDISLKMISSLNIAIGDIAIYSMDVVTNGRLNSDKIMVKVINTNGTEIQDATVINNGLNYTIMVDTSFLKAGKYAVKIQAGELETKLGIKSTEIIGEEFNTFASSMGPYWMF